VRQNVNLFFFFYSVGFTWETWREWFYRVTHWLALTAVDLSPFGVRTPLNDCETLKGGNSLCCMTDVVPINERRRILIRFETIEAFKSLRIVLQMKYYSRIYWEVLLNAEFNRNGPDFAVRVATLYDFVITLKHLKVSWLLL